MHINAGLRPRDGEDSNMRTLNVPEFMRTAEFGSRPGLLPDGVSIEGFLELCRRNAADEPMQAFLVIPAETAEASTFKFFNGFQWPPGASRLTSSTVRVCCICPRLGPRFQSMKCSTNPLRFSPRRQRQRRKRDFAIQKQNVLTWNRPRTSQKTKRAH